MKTLLPLFAVSLLALAGCEHIVHSPTKLSQNKIELHQDAVFEDVSVQDLDSVMIAQMSQLYRNNGSGGLDLSVTYDPRSKTNTAMHASSEIARIIEDFERHGVTDIESTIIPVKGQGSDARALISFTSLTAKGPADCTLMPGLTHNDIDVDKDYQIGCSMNTLIAQQVARPKDLGGQDVVSDLSSGRRAANMTEAYQAGIRNAPIEGERASD